MTGEDNPQGGQDFGGGGFGGGFPGGFGFGGIDIEELMRQGFFGGGHPHDHGQHEHHGHHGHHGGQRRQRGHTTYTFSFGGG